jgi:hypothetical protein
MMKKFTEWRQEEQQAVSPELLIKELDEMAHNLEMKLKGFQGERFDGFMELIGGVKALQQNIASIKHGVR